MSPGIRPIKAADRDRLATIVRTAGNFNEDEVHTAVELIESAIEHRNKGDYIAYVLEEGGQPAGYVCIGPAPLTQGVYDLYWVAVDPATRGKGYGQQLMKFAEEEVKRRGGRMIIIETSSLDSYTASRGLYVRSGYDKAAQIRDFYRPGDDKIIYVKVV